MKKILYQPCGLCSKFLAIECDQEESSSVNIAISASRAIFQPPIWLGQYAVFWWRLKPRSLPNSDKTEDSVIQMSGCIKSWTARNTYAKSVGIYSLDPFSELVACLQSAVEGFPAVWMNLSNFCAALHSLKGILVHSKSPIGIILVNIVYVYVHSYMNLVICFH